MMRKTILFFSMVCFALSAMCETVFTFATAADMNQTKDGITISFAQGDGSTAPTVTTDYETQKPEMRVYVGNTITISGANLTDIQLVCAKSSASNKNYAEMSANTGTLVSGGEAVDKNDWKIDTWTGSATSVVFTFAGTKAQRRIQKIVINGTATIDPVEDALPTEDDLDWTYVYQEPEIVHVPTSQVFGKEYAFIDGNILVHCSKGSIVKASEEEDAYFGCQANQTITFSATDYIKGIAIKGNVRKEFSATTSRGDISYCTDPDQETAANPVLVVRNVNALSVTINCDKNLSCYEVKVYFEENPEIACEEIDIPGETIFLNYDTASVELDTDESKAGHYVYMLYLWDKTNEWIYLGLDINTPTQNDFAGMYSMESGNMTGDSFFQYGEEYEDYSYANEGQMVINKKGNIYSISGYITCENKNTYNFSFSGPLGGMEEDVQGIKNVQRDKGQGTKVIIDGKLFLKYKGTMYDILGGRIKN